ncbi:AAA family ATPase [Pilimelia columellifera]|uniref:Pilus assembly protein CpaE n=1 Tax=Pilimelia columellifera subsp. columellifera TaxID=706583 RepID=A0ABP6AZU6_9ACTN
MTIYCEPPGGAPRPEGLPGQVTPVDDFAALDQALAAQPDTQLVVLGPGVAMAEALRFASGQRIAHPSLGVVLLRGVVELAVLAEAIRAGVREVVPASEPAALALACERSLDLSRQLGATVRPIAGGPESREAKLITVFAGKGGCGKSTVSTNLAAILAAGGSRRVLLIDLDLQFGDVAIMLQLEPERSIADAIPMAGRLDEAAVRSLLTKYRPGLDALLAPAGPAEGDHVTRELIGEIIGVARQMFDYIVVDTPPYFSDQVLATLDLTDWFALVVTPDLPTLKSVRLTQDMFELLEYPKERRLAILNRADSQVGLTISDIEKAVGMSMNVLMPSSRDVPLSVNRGVPIAVDNPNHPVSRSIKELADRCTGESSRPATHRRGFKVFGRRG